MQTQSIKLPIHLDIDSSPILEQLSFSFLNKPTEIRWARDCRKVYTMPEMPNAYCDGSLLLCDRTEAEVRSWLNEKTEGECLSKKSVQYFLDGCSKETLPLLPPPIAVSEVNGAASFMHFDIGFEKPLSINSEAYEWLTREGYHLFYQPDGRKKGVVLKRKDDEIAGILMPGDIDLTIRQIYMKALKPHAAFEVPEKLPVEHSNSNVMQAEIVAKWCDSDVKVTTPGFITGRTAVSHAFTIIENLYEYNKYSTYFVQTGYKDIDRMLGGIAYGDLVVASGDMVSSFLLNIIRKNAGQLNKPVTTAVCCLHGETSEFSIKLMCMEKQQLVASEIKRGVIKEKDWCLLSSAAWALAERPLFFLYKLPSSIDDMIERVRALKTEKRDLRLFVLDNLEMITGDDAGVIGEGLRKLKLIANELSISVVIGSSANMRFKKHKRNIYERYADALLLLRKNEKDYTTEIITHEKDDARFDYDEKLRGVIKVCTGNTILVKYPVEVQLRNRDGLLGTAIVQYMPQKGIFVNAK